MASGSRALSETEPGNMDHGSEVARPTTVESTNLGMAGAVQGGQAHMSASAFHGQLGAAAARRASFEASAAAYQNSAEFARHGRAAAGRGEVPPVAVFHRGEPAHGAACATIGEFRRQLGPVGVVLVVVGPQLHHNYGYSVLQPRPGAGHGEMLVDLLADGAGVVYNNYTWQPYPGAGHGEVFVGLLTDGVFAQQTRADGNAGALREPSLGVVYDNGYMVAEHLRRLLPFAGIGVSSLAVNGLAAGPGSPAVAFHLFVMLLGGLFLLILHVLRV